LVWFAIFELDVSAGAKVPIAHSHDAYEETIYGIEASSPSPSKDAKSKSAPATRSASLDIPLGAVHRFDNLYSATSKTLAIISPRILIPDYFREIATIAKAAATSVPPTPPDPKALA
jgi:hypothetical protein